MKKKVIYILLIILAVNFVIIGSKIPKIAENKSRHSVDNTVKALNSLYSTINLYMARFFDENKSMIFYKDIGVFAKNHNIQIRSINFSKVDNFDYKAMNFKEVEYDLTASGNYTDIKNFIFRLDNHKYIGSFAYVRMNDSLDGQNASGEILFEAKYKLYSLSGLKKINEETLNAVKTDGISDDYVKISFDKFDLAEKSPGKSIFTLIESVRPVKNDTPKINKAPVSESSSVEVMKNKTLNGYEITINKVAEKPEKIVNNLDTSEIEKAKKLIKGMRYIGYLAGKKSEVKAFIEVSGRVMVVNEEYKLSNGYIVKKIDNNFVKLQNFDEPYDIIELGLERSQK